MALSFKEVAEILTIIDSSECEEVIVEVEGTRIVVRRGGSTPATAAPPPLASRETPTPSEPGTTRTPETSAKAHTPTLATSTQITVDDTQTLVRSPMVGTFYRCPAPGEDPFVEVGTQVKKGAALCLIEVMKLYTTIESPCDGIIAAIHVEDSGLIEFDQVLFAIK
jgi:acetyl-CoA carboxylase biotin carboxyl carrier protein